MWGGVGKCGELCVGRCAGEVCESVGKCGEVLGGLGRRVGRCGESGEMWGDLGRCGDMWGDMGRYGEMCCRVRQRWAHSAYEDWILEKGHGPCLLST